MDEVRLSRALSHQHIVRLLEFEYKIVEHTVFILLEYCDYGDLVHVRALKHNASQETCTSPSFLPNSAALHEESVSRSRSNLRPKKDKQYVHVRVQQSEGEHADGPEDDGHA